MSGILKQFAVSAMEGALLKSKFRGCILGSLAGDCLGSPWEGDEISEGEKMVIQRYFDQLSSPELKGPPREYTDDTAMTKCILKCLLEKPEIDYKHLAKLFCKEFYQEPKRGYGANITDVFAKLRKSKFQDIYKPADEQFNGSGSFGNGGAMRIAPIALYYHNNYKLMLEVARNVTRLTHTNPLGVNGALLQCIAVHQALYCDSRETLDTHKFCESLIEKMKPIEAEEDDLGMKPKDEVYNLKLRTVQHFLKAPYNDEFNDEVLLTLGNTIEASESVPTAIFCFLMAVSRDIPRVETDNLFRKTIQYAITLGGDTDTIASMAGAIAGAYLGEESINPDLIRHCESSKEMIDMADDLLNNMQK